MPSDVKDGHTLISTYYQTSLVDLILANLDIFTIDIIILISIMCFYFNLENLSILTKSGQEKALFPTMAGHWLNGPFVVI